MKKRVETKNDCTIVATAKCSDLWSHYIKSADGTKHSAYDGYVPSFMPGEHFGDYVMLEINPYSGRITNWKPWKRASKRKAKR